MPSEPSGLAASVGLGLSLISMNLAYLAYFVRNFVLPLMRNLAFWSLTT